MPAEIKKEIQFEIGHVLFIDIVGYSKLLINEQSEQLQRLKEIARGTEQFRRAEAEGKLLRLPTGDGGALVFRTSPEAPVLCAMEIAKALKDYPKLGVRMGIHSGPVNEISDLNEQANMAGAGINIAQRVMDCGDAGHILLSKHVAEDLEQYPRWRPLLHDLGECAVKHDVRVHVVNLYTEELGNAEMPERFARAKEQQTTGPTRSFARPVGQKFASMAGFTVLFIALITGILFLSRHGVPKSAPIAATTPAASPSSSPHSTIVEKSIAVLPFENLSANQENAFFADGVQDEILTDLAKVADLKVISRTSVIQYRSSVARNLREIGQQLGVVHVVEGSVQRVGNRVRVNAQLVDARTDAHLWAQTYDRDLADVFAIQSEIAKAIVDQLQAKLSPSEKAAIERPPTADLAAFDLYTRAKTLLLSSTFSARLKDNYLEAVDLLNQAVARDPGFLLSYCQLALAHDRLYFFDFDHTPARLASANAAVQAALRLQPDAGEAHLALAQHLYNGYLDYDHARAEIAIAQRTLPNDSVPAELLGYIARRQGKWEESTQNLERASELDPRNSTILQQISLNYLFLHSYDQMAAVWDRALAIAPKDLENRVQRAQVDLHRRADTRLLHNTIESILADDPASAPVIANSWLNLALYERDPAAANRALVALSGNTFGGGLGLILTRHFGEGLIARLRGDSVAARAAFTAARAEQEEVIRTQPDYAPALCVLGLIDAGLGRKDEALREGRRAVELLPVTRDAFSGQDMIQVFAIICAWTGEKELALKQLAIMTQAPNSLSYGRIRLHPFWDPLHGDPRFEKIVASLAPK